MPTILASDDRLIEEARKLGRHRTKWETVTAALNEYIQRRKQQNILSLFGTIDYEQTYDYKRERRRSQRQIPARVARGERGSRRRVSRLN